MSSETACLALYLNAPMQSWGNESRFNRRNTGLLPSKSAIAGMCCAAHGFSRGSSEEKDFLLVFRELKMTSIILPRKNGKNKELTLRKQADYHTVKDTKTADGKTKASHITYRQYLTDTAFGVLLEGEKGFLSSTANALQDPVWGIWLGRKAFIPSAPVLRGVKDSKEEALTLLVGDLPLDNYTRQEDADGFSDGSDTLNDHALSFSSNERFFVPRRVATVQKGQ